MAKNIELSTWPDKDGRFNGYGGLFVPETLMTALHELENMYNQMKDDEEFNGELNRLQSEYNGRATPLTFADRLTDHYGKAKIYLKREDLCHTGAHKMNNALGQILLAKRLGKKRIIAEDGRGSARSRHSNCLRKVWIKMCCVYGRS